MQLEDYFDFHGPTDIRLKGSEIGVEVILSAYLDLALFAEEIPARHPALTLEQVYATLTYYWRNREAMESYLRQAREIPGRIPPLEGRVVSPAAQRLREMAGKRDELKRRATGS